MTALEDAAAVLHDAVGRVAAEFGQTPIVLRDAREEADPVRPGTAAMWVYLGRVARTADADAATARVAAGFAATGWTVTNRDTDREHALQLSRDGVHVGVQVGLAPGADVVIGGSTPSVAVPA